LPQNDRQPQFNYGYDAWGRAPDYGRLVTVASRLAAIIAHGLPASRSRPRRGDRPYPALPPGASFAADPLRITLDVRFHPYSYLSCHKNDVALQMTETGLDTENLDADNLHSMAWLGKFVPPSQRAHRK
jgi:hypothetical protein